MMLFAASVPTVTPVAKFNARSNVQKDTTLHVSTSDC